MVTFRFLTGDVLGVFQWTVEARVSIVQCRGVSVLHLVHAVCGKELETVSAGHLMWKAESFLREHAKAPDIPYHIILLYKGNVLNPDWMLSGRTCQVCPVPCKFFCSPSRKDLIFLNRSR